jgi:hypothetical protein
MERIYHIYARDKCLFHSLTEDEFKVTWSAVKNLVGIMKTEYTIDDLSYEELVLSKKVSLESSH